MSTLILRDVTLAICGAPESRGDNGEHLALRMAEVRALAPEVLEEYLGVLLAADGLGEDVDLEILTALMILGLALPEICETKGFTGLSAARRVAARLEQEGQPDAALSIIEELRSMYPEHKALERDYDAVLGRLGMVLNLADRYYDRAQQLLADGEREEAVSWLREVLLLDSTRKDVARQIRDLRLTEMRPKNKIKIRWGLLGMGIFIPLALAGVVMREKDLSDRYERLPIAEVGDLQSGKIRLAALNRFSSSNPIWHGAIFVERERTSLRLTVDRLTRIDAKRKKELDADLAERTQRADAKRLEGRQNVGFGRFEDALSLFEEALEHAPKDWEHAQQVARDIEVIRAHVADLAAEGTSK